MNDADREERALLKSAREDLSPSADDVARVWRATRGALDGGGAASASVQPPSAALPRRVAATTSAVQWMGALSIAVVSGAVGYALGLRASVQPTPPTPAASAPAPTANPPARSAPALAEPRKERIAARPPPLEPASPELGDRTRGARRPEAATASIEKELEAMRRVERLLRDDEPRAALAVLDALDRSIPNGRLAQERAAAAVMARCALGDADPSQLERSFAERYPRSVYLTRVRTKCSGDLRNRSEPDTHE